MFTKGSIPGLCEALVPLMRRDGGGRIVNVSSGAGSLSEMGAGTPAYSVSKAALNALTVKLAAELEGTGILLNSVCPGWVWAGSADDPWRMGLQA
jgi:NAD(P)-dependent dehydrogenase (short-subunit alcohol dehydrogenase family)